MNVASSRRLAVIEEHFASSPHSLEAAPTSASLGQCGTKSPDDVVIVHAVRTAIGKARRGSFRNTAPDNLLMPLIKHVMENTPQVNPTEIGDVVIGTVLPRGGQGATEVRVACLLAGLPEEVPCTTVNRQCSSGLQAIANVASSIKAGLYDVAIAGGVESMSLNPMAWEGQMNQEALKHKSAIGCYTTMGQTSENVAERYGITRAQQDKLAAMSQERAIAATKNGRFKEEIVPITVTVEDEKSGESKQVTVDTDEGLRATTMEKLAKLRPAFKVDGSTTAGNSSQVSDGASICLLARRSYAEKHGLPILGCLRSFAAVGVEPSVMGIGPAAAIPVALKKAGLTLQDIDLYEINEAFASQATYCVDKLGLSWDNINVNGGAIAIGHPLGCTGSRMTATLLHELHKRRQKYGVVSMCIGSGMGAAAVFEAEC